MKPVAWIKEQELAYMSAVVELGGIAWQTNLGLKPEPGDVPLYTAPREWVGLTDEEIDLYAFDEGVTDNKAPAWLVTYARGIEAKLKEKNR